MYVEIYDLKKQQVLCRHKIKVHAMAPVRVGLTFGNRLQRVYACVDCGVACVKLTRKCTDYTENTMKSFEDFMCVKYEDKAPMLKGYA